eukprot:TRINITY_DN1265_c0_g1_i2.p1 TRINITY_DN1265_c0_g1~~TRINITY_DN1265_c0_g1_i2.p1  ORF type:complete len:534 (-),score=130.22 TRINITY_DN1265_c0_g1_i2:137-1588(-)
MARLHEETVHGYSFFPQAYENPQALLPAFHPFAEFSEEDNQLLMRVLHPNSHQNEWDLPNSYNPNPYFQHQPMHVYNKNNFNHHVVKKQPHVINHNFDAPSPFIAPVSQHRLLSEDSSCISGSRGRSGSNGSPQSFHIASVGYIPHISNVSSSELSSPIDRPHRGSPKQKEALALETLQKNKRRESQNRASRNYRQRKKEYIKDIENKLAQLSLENEKLRTETIKNKILASQLGRENAALRNTVTNGPKPHPLYRSYSNEIQNMDKKIEKIILALEKAARDQCDDVILRNLLGDFHKHVKERQDMLTKEVQQLVNPKMQEKFARLSGVPHKIQSGYIDRELQEWLKQLSEQGVSRHQLDQLKELQNRHFADLKLIYNEREQINEDIREFYQEKVIGAQMVNCYPKLDDSSILVLGKKLELLKQNLERENEATNRTLLEFGNILSPYQEAILTLKYYDLYRTTVSSLAMLNNVWKALSSQKNDS